MHPLSPAAKTIDVVINEVPGEEGEGIKSVIIGDQAFYSCKECANGLSEDEVTIN